MKRRDLFRTDFSAFMSIIFMLAGCLLILLISNLAATVSDPGSMVISAIVRAPGFETGGSGNQTPGGRIVPGGNTDKLPHYVDVHRDALVLLPAGPRLTLRQLGEPGNPFEQLLTGVASNRAREYIVLMVRPRTTATVRQLRRAITDRGIDVGIDLYESDTAPAVPPPATSGLGV